MTKRGVEDDADAQGRDPMVRCKIEQRINGTHFRVPGQKKYLPDILQNKDLHRIDPLLPHSRKVKNVA